MTSEIYYYPSPRFTSVDLSEPLPDHIETVLCFSFHFVSVFQQKEYYFSPNPLKNEEVHCIYKFLFTHCTSRVKKVLADCNILKSCSI